MFIEGSQRSESRFSDADIFLPAKGRLPWKKKGPKPANTCIPQLRLFTMELAIITLAGSENCVVVYAGAARGQHIPALSHLFPSIKFYLYDPHNFAITPTSQIIIMKRKFTDKIANEWRHSGQNVIFISDIRTMERVQDYEERIGIDMVTQARWVEIMKPVWWSLKFRIPYPIVTKGETYHYLPGWLMFQPFTKNLSMEMRLIGNKQDSQGGVKSQTYDTRDLEQQLYYHNTQVRPDLNRFNNIYSQDQKPYDHQLFNRGFDMTYLLHVVDNYLKSRHAVSLGENDSLKFVESLILSIGV